MPRFSNELKAAVVLEDILEVGSNAPQDKCMTVQDFNYSSLRKRDHTGAAYGSSEPVMLDFTVRINASIQSKPFYSYLMSDEYFSLTFIFNAVFNHMKRLSGYDDAMVINGYVIELKENFLGSISGEDNEQMSLNVRMLVRNITYIGKESNKTITFINNTTEL